MSFNSERKAWREQINELELKPFKREIIHFDVKRSENPFVTAYETAKGTYTVQEYNSETHKMEEVEKPMPFNGWENDIVVEETEADKLFNYK